MAKNKQYTADDISVLSDSEHVRLRTDVYLGNTLPADYTLPTFTRDGVNMQTHTFIPAVFKGIGEILDNSIDEFAQTNIKNPTLLIESIPTKGYYKISDNGRGVPIDKHATGPYTPEVVFGQLRSGRNFSDDKESGVIGQNGVGSSCVNYCSTEFNIDIIRDKKRYVQKFSRGGELVGNPSIKKSSAKTTGTSISFYLDPLVFENVTIPEQMVYNRANEIAFTNPGVTVACKVNENKIIKYKYKNGLSDIVKSISSNYYRFEDENMEFFVIFDAIQSEEEKMFTWVNSSLLFDGGICNTQFTNLFYSKMGEHFEKRAKKDKISLQKSDLRQNILILGNLKVNDPRYDSQSKTRMTGPCCRANIGTMFNNHWTIFTKKNKAWLESVYERAATKGDAKATRAAEREMSKLSQQKIPGLLDASSKKREDCILLVTEGLSAAAMIAEVRDAQTVASYPLTGKINNVYGARPASIMKMGKITNLIASIGLKPGKKAIRSELRYGRIGISTDADYDGDDIFTLLCNLFYQFWPELMDPNEEPFIYRLVAPNVVASKGKVRKHFPNMDSFRKVEQKYSAGWSIEYMKGLGSMIEKDWDMILNETTECLIPIQDVDGTMKDTLSLLFSDDRDGRKEWLTA